MFSVGQPVVYGVQGVCRIQEVTTKKFGRETEDYFVLQPIFDGKSLLYVPCGNQNLLAQMRPVLTREELGELIASAAQADSAWMEDEKQRRALCTEIIKSGDRAALMRLIAMMYQRFEALREQKKHIPLADERLMKQASRLLHDEFAFVLDIQPDEVPDYIARHI